MPRSRAWQPIVGQMGFRGAQVLGKSMPTTREQSWIKLGWMRIGTEMTYMNYDEAVRTRSEDTLKAVSEKVSIHIGRACEILLARG